MEAVSLEDLVTQVRQAAGPDPLDRVDTAVALAASMTGRADALVDRFVADARQAGLSWTDIGARLGVTKQAARKRFTDRPPTPVLDPQVRLQPRLQACLDRAHDLARGDGAAEVGTHHLLAGLLAEGVAAAILERLGVTVQAIHASAARLFGPPPPVGADEPPALSADAVCAIEAAAHHAQGTAPEPGRAEVGTEHLLLVLALDPGSRARRVLLDLGTDIAPIKKELACHLTLNPRRIGRPGRRRRRTGPACSFCGAAETPARPLVHGPGVAICSTCTTRAGQALEKRAA
jgi:ClpX C4-type zinc finger/Clp amino terminal domain, pathogenicity island component